MSNVVPIRPMRRGGDPEAVGHALDVLDSLRPPTPRERHIANWKMCVDVLQHKGLYRPSRPGVTVKWWTHADDMYINVLRRTSPDELRDKVEAKPIAFGAYRDAVLNAEGENARKLQTLAWVIQTACTLRDLPNAETSVIDRIIDLIGDFLRIEWQILEVPTTGDYREWAVRASRLYEDCPRFWRDL